MRQIGFVHWMENAVNSIRGSSDHVHPGNDSIFFCSPLSTVETSDQTKFLDVFLFRWRHFENYLKVINIK